MIPLTPKIHPPGAGHLVPTTPMRTAILLGLVVLTGCFFTKKPELTAPAQEVRLLLKAEPGPECKEIGDISTGNDWYIKETDVKIVLRNRAAELGANFATWDMIKKNGRLLAGSGRAFTCP